MEAVSVRNRNPSQLRVFRVLRCSDLGMFCVENLFICIEFLGLIKLKNQIVKLGISANHEAED